MTKIKTVEHLQNILDEELAWRKKELAVIKSLVTEKSSRKDLVNCHIRCGVALIYAHWEGFIKAAGSAYLTFIASQRLTYLELAKNFIAVAVQRSLNEAGLSNKLAIYVQITDFFTNGLTDRCILPLEVQTKSNLSSEVLREVVYTLGLDYKEYETKAKLIDETLLKSRNEIAHGKYLLISVEQFTDLHSAVIELLDLFSNQISNAASTKAYKRTPNA